MTTAPLPAPSVPPDGIPLPAPERLAHFAELAEAWDRCDWHYPQAELAELYRTGTFGARLRSDPPPTIRAVVEATLELARWNASLARAVVDSNLGPAAMVEVLGLPEHRARLVASMAEGLKPAIAMTEAGAGSNLAAVRTVLEHSSDRLLLTGEKRWITGAPASRDYVVLARSQPGAVELAPPQARCSRPGSAAPAERDGSVWALVLVDSRQEGVAFDEPPRMLGMRGLPEGTVRFERVEVPSTDVLAIGAARTRCLELYNTQRLGAAAVAMGIAWRAFELAVEEVRRRPVAGGALATKQGVRWRLAELFARLEPATACLRAVADEAGEGLELDPGRVALAKLLAARAASEAADEAIQLFGADGFTDGPVSRLWRDGRMFRIAGGTAEVLLDRIAAGIVGDG